VSGHITALLEFTANKLHCTLSTVATVSHFVVFLIFVLLGISKSLAPLGLEKDGDGVDTINMNYWPNQIDSATDRRQSTASHRS